jgi:anti-sigma B factor antagonist
VRIQLRDAGKVVVLDLQGELKLGGGDEELREAVRDLLAEDRSALVLNMQHVPWLDTSGISALVVVKKRAMKQGGDVRLLRLSGRVREELKLVHLLEVFQTFEDETQAIGSF